MSAPKRQKRDGRESAAASSLAALSDEVLVHALTFADKRGVFAAAGACWRWREVVHGEKSVPLWKSLVEAHHPRLIAAMSSATSSGWRDAFLRTAKLTALADESQRRRVARFAESIRESEDHFVYGWCGPSIGHPYPSPTAGTTATATPNAHGAFSEPVYYDWGANWDRVSDLVPTQPVQDVLKKCVVEAYGGYYFCEWDEDKVWPFLFNGHRRVGNGEEHALMGKYLPHSSVSEMNGLIANWYSERGVPLLRAMPNREYDPKCAAENWVKRELESNETISDDDYASDEWVDEWMLDEDALWEMIRDDRSGRKLVSAIEAISEAHLYNKNSPLRETLLCTTPNSYAFMPLNYVLAKLLSAEDAEFKIYASDKYSVVVDVRHNIVFDNFWYFVGQSASEALKRSRDRPQLTSFDFDYSLGGLA
ncbi:hypothetical protein ACHAWF_018703 [Thalassiosira exigua]